MLVAVLTVSLVAGLVLQRSRFGAEGRAALWWFSFWLLAPLLVLAAFLTIDLDRRLLLVLAAAIASNWLVLAAAYGYAALVTRERDERGCLALAGAFGNTGYLGVPLALLVLGPAGVAPAVLYDRLSWLVPQTAISTAIARTHGTHGDATEPGRRLRAVVLNPPLAAMVVALLLRTTGGEPAWANALRDATAYLIGPTGFLLLGLSLPLERASLAARELRAGAGAIAIRVVGGPLALLAIGAALGVHVPRAFVLAAAVPGAFHLLVLARVYGLRPVLMRALVVGSSGLAVILAAALRLFG